MPNVNDITITVGIVIVFVGCGLILPFINDAFSGTTNIQADTSALTTGAAAGTAAAGITLGSVLGSIAKMFFWTFGDIPFWLDAFIFIPMRIALLVIVVRNFPIIGAGGG